MTPSAHEHEGVDRKGGRLAVRPENLRYRRDSAFSYVCHGCSRCCHDKVIQVNPYEVARLAQNRALSTTEVRARYTEANGTVLKRTAEGACIFLTPQGCGVHGDRPLVCRLYPLGRHVTAEGEETFRELTPHSQTEGEYGVSGTVQEFLATQGAPLFIEAVDRYVELVGSMIVKLHEVSADRDDRQADLHPVLDGVAPPSGPGESDWMDMDRAVARYCLEQGIPVPGHVTDKMHLHIRAMGEWLEKP